MTDTPKHIWAEQSGYLLRHDGVYLNAGRWSDDELSGLQEYLRADIARAVVVEALKLAAEEAETEGWGATATRIGFTEREEASRDCAERVATAIRAIDPEGLLERLIAVGERA